VAGRTRLAVTGLETGERRVKCWAKEELHVAASQSPRAGRGTASLLAVARPTRPMSTPRQGTEAEGLVAGRQQHAPTQVNVAPTARA